MTRVCAAARVTLLSLGLVPIAAAIAFEYTQRDTVVRVAGKIENGTCAASGGDYTMVLSFRDDNGELKTLEFGETWQRSDDRPVEFSTDYPVGESVDLVGVRSRRLRCVCAGTREESLRVQ